ncbi:MAG: peptidylprolyl isomerase [Nanoarchaeota archaeon]|nr:peptidylprolyl isomerase [Nanoarchaeota archaeon]
MKKITKMLAIFLILIASLALAGCSAKDLTGRFVEENEGTGSGIVALVNGEEIYEDYMERQYEIISVNYQTYGMELSKIDLLKNALIPQMILVQEAKKEGIEVTDEEVTEFVDTEMAKIMESMPEEELLTQLNSMGITLEELKSDNALAYRTQLYIQRLLEKSVWSGIEVSDKEVQDYYDNNINQFKEGEQVRASHILVETESEAENILSQIRSGSDFEELAQEHSTCPSSEEGGDLGYFAHGSMVPEFEEVAFALKVGEISDVVETQFGYHIIKLTSKKEGGTSGFDEVKDELTQQLMIGKQRAAEEVYINQLKDMAEIEILLEEPVEETQIEVDAVGKLLQ